MKLFNINIFLLILFISGCVNNEKAINIKLINDDLKFTFNEKKIVLDYEILDMNSYNKKYGSYRAVLEGRDINTELSEVIIKNYKDKDLKDNNVYIFSSGFSGKKGQPGVVLESINFCLKGTRSLIQEKTESNDTFLKKCHDF